MRSGDDRQVCHRLLQRLALARRTIIRIYFPPIPWPMTQGQQLRDQRGGKSSTFLIGTTEAAHHVFYYLNFEWDAHKIDMTFTKKRIIPSPHHMRTYEMIDFSSPSLGTDLFTNHHDIPVGKEPCFEVSRVSSYSNAITLRRYLLALCNALSHNYDNNKHNDGPGLC